MSVLVTNPKEAYFATVEASCDHAHGESVAYCSMPFHVLIETDIIDYLAHESNSLEDIGHPYLKHEEVHQAIIIGRYLATQDPSYIEPDYNLVSGIIELRRKQVFDENNKSIFQKMLKAILG